MEINYQVRCNNCMLVQSEDITVCIDCKTDKYLMQPFMPIVTNKADAVTQAIDWQNWASEQNLSYGELADWGDHFYKLAKKYNNILRV